MSKSNSLALGTHVSGQANKPLSKPAHSLFVDDLVEEIGANKDDGLTSDEAKRRIDEYGVNDLGEESGVNVGKILLAQVANAMTLVSSISSLAIAVFPTCVRMGER